MNNSGEYPVGDTEPYDAQALIGELSFRELTEIEGRLRVRKRNPWGNIVNQERLSRQRDLQALREYAPADPETPPYNYLRDPDTYIQTIRQGNLAARVNPAVISNALPAERLELDNTAARLRAYYMPELHAANPLLSYDDWTDFLAVNLRTILLAPRAAAYREFEAAKYNLIRDHIPLIPLVSNPQMFYSAHKMDITAKQIAAARKAVEETLVCKAPQPDFFQLNTEQQAEAVAAFGSQFMEWLRFMSAIDPQIFRAQAHRREATLAYRSLEELQAVIGQYPKLKPADICKIFLRSPFNIATPIEAACNAEKLAAYHLEAEKQRRAAAPANPAQPQQATSSESRPGEATSENMQEIMQLVEDPKVTQDVLDAAFGEKVALTPESAAVTRADLDDIVDKHVQLIGRALWESLPHPNPQGLVLGKWNKFDVGEALRAKFNGTLYDLTLTQFPVTEEQMEKMLKSTYDPDTMHPEATICLFFEVDMKSTGKPVQKAFLNMLMGIRRASNRAKHDAVVKHKTSATTNSLDIVQSMHLDAVANARRLEGIGYRRPPLDIGLPTVGKRHTRTTGRN